MGNLVLERRIGESIYMTIGDVSIGVLIVRTGQAVKLKITAPPAVAIYRGEFLGAICDKPADDVTRCNNLKGCA